MSSTPHFARDDTAASGTAPAAASAPAGIDPRGPRVTAGVTAVLAAVVVGSASAGLVAPAVAVLAALAVAFVIGTVGGVRRNPLGLVFTRLVRPRLRPPTELEDPRPPTFAQGVGAAITLLGLALTPIAPATAPLTAGALVFIAAFLNSVFAFCLGCQLYLLGRRAQRALGFAR